MIADKKEIDIKVLRTELIFLYNEFYLVGRTNSVVNLAKEMDGEWSIAFLLPPDIGYAINAITSIYIEPYLSKKEAGIILRKLKTENSELISSL
jgi:hypothetical protein